MVTGTIVLYMCTGTIVLYMCTIVDFSQHNPSPSPHRFKSVPLQSGFWDTKEIPELVSEKKSIAARLSETKDECKGLSTDLKDIKKAKVVDAVADESKNGPLRDMKEAYPTYFDEDSGNTNREGMDQLEKYLREEVSAYKNKVKELKKNMEEIDKVLEAKKAVEENKNMILPFITAYSPILFSIFLTIFSFCIYFKLIDFYPLNFYMPEIVVPAIITSTVLFI